MNRRAWAAAAAVLAAACGRDAKREVAPERVVTAPPPLRNDAGPAARAEPAGAWTGGATWVVQTGDVLDRGDDEQAILDWFERLERDAAAAGGRFVWLLGNHELMNAAGDLRYVTPGGFKDFADVPGLPLAPCRVKRAADQRSALHVVGWQPGATHAQRWKSPAASGW